MERGKETKNYQIRNERYILHRNRIIDVIDRGHVQSSQWEPLGINGFTPQQENMLTIAIAVALSPDLLKLSHCAHRAVGSCIALYYPEITDEQFLKIANSLGQFVSYRARETGERVIYTWGTNNWDYFESASAQNLSCKLTPGTPLEVPRDHLIHLGESKMDNIGDVDNACPKRTLGLSCNIVHAERDAIERTTKVLRMSGIPPAGKTVLATTWVPCPNCVNLITQESSLYGEISVFSACQAQGDPQDLEMSQKIRESLDADRLGTLLGPFIEIPKTPGYGWYPARDDFASRVSDSVSKKKYLDRDRVLLLLRALSLLVDPHTLQG